MMLENASQVGFLGPGTSERSGTFTPQKQPAAAHMPTCEKSVLSAVSARDYKTPKNSLLFTVYSLQFTVYP